MCGKTTIKREINREINRDIRKGAKQKTHEEKIKKGNKNNAEIKEKKVGISLIALVITIIVIIILAAIVMIASHRTVGQANYAKFVHELSEVQDKVTIKRAEGKAEGVGEELKDKYFTKVYIENAPEGFVSFDDNAMTGYWVGMDTINEKDIPTGHEKLTTDRVTFGVEDVYVYDAKGTVYYARGWLDENDEWHYSIEKGETIKGPKIESVTYEISADKTKAIVKVIANPSNGGELNVVIDGKSATKISANEYLAEVTKNGSILVIAEEAGGGNTSKSITITGIEVKDITAPVITGLTSTSTTTSIVITGNARDDESKIIGYKFTDSASEPSDWAEANSNSISVTYNTSVSNTYHFWVKNEEGLVSSQKITVEFKKVYTITYNANGGSLGNVPSSETKEQDSGYTISNQKPSREGYEFQGWATSMANATSGIVKYNCGEAYAGNVNLELFAVWKEITVDVSSLSVEEIGNKTYTGSEIRPTPQVKDGSTTLTQGTHYTLSYTNNTDVGTATITITGKGKYIGTKSVTFEIVEADMEGVTAKGYDGAYDGNAHGIEVNAPSGATIKYGTVQGTYDKSSSPTYTDVSTYTVYYKVTKPNYNDITGEATIRITVKSVNDSDAQSKLKISSVADQIYTGSEIKPTPTITYATMTLKKDTDYTLSYSKNVNAGTATITATFKGNFTGTASVTFKILPKDITGMEVKVEKELWGYTGSEIKPKVTIKNLEENTDYTLSYINNINLGTATIKAIGKGNYIGEASTTFKILLSYTVTYDANRGTISGSASEEKLHNIDYTIEKEVTRLGYKFLGWAEEKTGAEVKYKAGDKYTVNADITLYAVWEGLELANAPVLGRNASGDLLMQAVYWNYENEKEELTADEYDQEMYCYAKGDNETDTKQAIWANAKTVEDGSYWVWIPRYAYKITYYTDDTKATVSEAKTQYGSIDVLFLKGTSNTEYYDGEGGVVTTGLPEGYKVHPAFQAMTNEEIQGGMNSLGKWDSELEGIWVAKYEASSETSEDGINWVTATSQGNTLTTKAGNTKANIRMVSKPSVNGWRDIPASKMYSNSINMNAALNSHQMKNSEWGAVAYLTYSAYGRNGNELAVNQCTSYYTGGGPESGDSTVYNTKYSYEKNSFESTYAWNTTQGKLASTTGNIYGIYDMSGGAYEYVASYVNNRHASTYGENVVNGALRNKQVYELSSADSQQDNYNANTDVYGDAVYETSLTYTGKTSWCTDYSSFPNGSYAFFGRGGYHSRDAYAGVFFFGRDYGSNSSVYGFRPVLCLTSNNGEQTHVVRYEANGGSLGEVPNVVLKEKNASFTITTNEPTREGYIFAGWDVSKTAVTPTYIAGDKYTQNADLTLYAIWKISVGELTVNSLSAETYTGNSITPVITVKHNETTLTEGTDYTLNYENNTNAGTATVTITGVGSYTGTRSVTFEIASKSIEDATITLGETTYTYDGREKKPGVSVVVEKRTLSPGTEYSVAYTDNVEVGTATVTITGVNNYTGTKEATFTILEKKYTITYNANGGNLGNVPTTEEKTHDKMYTITSEKPSLEGFTFIGWAISELDAVAGTVAYNAGEEYTGNANLTLYAAWRSNNAVHVEGLGYVEISDINAELNYDPNTGDLGGAVPPVEDAPETPEEIPEEKLPEIIEFGYGKFEPNTTYTPGTYETVEYETTYTRTKYPVSYLNVVWSEWSITNDTEGNIISTEPGDMQLADIGEQYSIYIVYDFETEEALEANGVKGDSVELWTIFSSSEDSLENAVYLAAYLNKADGKTTRHIAMWNGTQYEEYDADADIKAIDTFTENYTVTSTKQVQITAPSSSTEYVYVPVGSLKAEKGMTWKKWLESEYNTTGETEPLIKTADYEAVSYEDAIVAGKDYGFVVCELSGRWIFNDILNFPENEITQEITYTVDYEYYDIRISPGMVEYYRYEPSYYDGWFDESFKTINFGTEPQVVSKEFYEWFTANATKVPLSRMTIYLSSEIPEWVDIDFPGTEFYFYYYEGDTWNNVITSQTRNHVTNNEDSSIGTFYNSAEYVTYNSNTEKDATEPIASGVYVKYDEIINSEYRYEIYKITGQIYYIVRTE